MKKTLALILALVMMLGMLAGCSNSAGNETQNPGANNPGGTNAGDPSGEVRDVTLKVWVPEEELEITQQMAESFNAAHPEYNFSIDISVVGIDEANSLLETDPDTSADIMQMPTGGIPAEVERGLLLPIVYEEATLRSLYGEGPWPPAPSPTTRAPICTAFPSPLTASLCSTTRRCTPRTR